MSKKQIKKECNDSCDLVGAGAVGSIITLSLIGIFMLVSYLNKPAYGECFVNYDKTAYSRVLEVDVDDQVTYTYQDIKDDDTARRTRSIASFEEYYEYEVSCDEYFLAASLVNTRTRVQELKDLLYKKSKE